MNRNSRSGGQELFPNERSTVCVMLGCGTTVHTFPELLMRCCVGNTLPVHVAPELLSVSLA
ncbi:hypothetical protein [Gemmatimonas sp.]|uniref:hypothetical protein n=1 Tax=Gemmatimonas sp. TaxID=1962908 RepID=UPI0037BFE4DF